jgi:hypothetical protein
LRDHTIKNCLFRGLTPELSRTAGATSEADDAGQ